MKRFALQALALLIAASAFAEPIIFEHHRPGAGNRFPIIKKAEDPLPAVYIPSLGFTHPTQNGETYLNAGYVAVRYDNSWHVRQASATRYADEYVVYWGQRGSDSGLYHVIAEAIAYPIDPRMKRSDIEGATIIRANADNTAWVFFHAEEEEHHDRELAIQAAIVGAFQRTLDDANLDVIRHRKNAAVQNAKILTYGRLIEFRDDWVGYALVAEQRKHIGHHIHDSTYVHECVIDSFNDAIKEWKKNKADAWTPIRYHVETVAKRRITTLHDYPEPWNHPTRRVIENLKKKKAEAAEAETSATEDGE